MKFLTALLLVPTLLMLAPVPVLAVDVKVIANSSVTADSISSGYLKSVYLRERSILGDGTHVEPVLAKSGGAHQAFLRQYLGKSDQALQMYYDTLVFTGKGSKPKALGSDAEVVAYVARTRGAIGYVSATADTGGTKTIEVVAGGGQANRALLIRVEPDYPETLQHLGIAGTVRLSVTISSKGTVETVYAVGGNPILAESATKAVKQWIYAASHTQTTIEVSIPFPPRR